MKNSIKFFYISLILVFISTCIFIFFENKYNELPIYKKINFSKFINEHNYNNDFINQNGLVVDFNKLITNKTILIDCFFTRCKSICPIVTLGVKSIFNKLDINQHNNIIAISFSVDPTNDNINELNLYRKRYKIEEFNNWIHITGKKEAIYKLIRDELSVNATPANSEEDDFIHSSQIILIDKKQQIRGYFDGTDSIQINKLLNNIKKL